MNEIRQLLQQSHSKEVSRYIRDKAVGNKAALEILMECFFDEDLRICQRAAWPVGLIGKEHVQLLYPYLERMLDNLKEPKHDAIIRNTFRSFQFMDFPEDLEGRVFDVSMDYLMNIENAIAIRVFAMTTASNITIKYPELAAELIAIIEEQLPHGSAGFKNRGSKLLKVLRNISV